MEDEFMFNDDLKKIAAVLSEIGEDKNKKDPLDPLNASFVIRYSKGNRKKKCTREEFIQKKSHLAVLFVKRTLQQRGMCICMKEHTQVQNHSNVPNATNPLGKDLISSHMKGLILVKGHLVVPNVKRNFYNLKCIEDS